MKNLLVLLAFLASPALAVDNPVSCTGSSCKVIAEPRTSTGAAVVGLTNDTSSGAGIGYIGSTSATGGGVYRFRVDDLNLGLQIRAGSTTSHFPLTIQTAGGTTLFTIDGTGAAAFIRDVTNTAGSFYQKVSNGAVSANSTGAPQGGTGSLTNTQFVDVTFATTAGGQFLFNVSDGGNNGDMIFCTYAAGTCTKVTSTTGNFAVGNGSTNNRVFMPSGVSSYVVRLKNCTGGSGSISILSTVSPVSSVSAVQTGTCP